MESRLLVRMTGPTVAVSVVLLAVGTIAAWYMHDLQDASSDLLVVNVGSLRASEEIEIGMREIRTLLNKFLRTKDVALLNSCRPLRDETDRWFREADRLSTTSRERDLMTAAKAGYQHFFEEFDRLAKDAADGTVEESQDEVERLIDDVLTREVLEPVHAYLDLNEELMIAASQRNQQVTDRMVFVLLLLGTCGALAGVTAGFAIARRVNRSIVQLTVPIRDTAGKLNEVVGPLTVATGRSFDELEEAMRHVGDQVATVVRRLQESERDALRAEQLAAVGQLAAGMAHELRNPLMSMKLLVQSASESGDEGCIEGRDLRVLEDVVGRVEQSVQSLLEFARPPRLEMSEFDVADVVRQTVDMVESRAAQRDVAIECDVPATTKLLRADQGQMRQLVLNLLINALDAVPQAGHVGVTLRWGTGPANANGQAKHEWMTLRVVDDGEGLPAGLGERIFEPFVSTKETGTGLGLSICRRIVEAHGGELLACDGERGGAEFTVRLPVT